MTEVVFFVIINVLIVRNQVHVQFVNLMELTDTPVPKKVDQVIMIAHVLILIMMMEPVTPYVNHVCGNVPVVTTPKHVSLVLNP
jgi:hypothetical protein